jgi:hypothetical protein
MKVYAAFYGEYEEAYPIGIFDSVEKAMQAVVNSKPSYNTEVYGYDTETGKVVETFHAEVPHRTAKDRTITWSKQ